MPGMSSPEVFHFPMPPQSARGSQSLPNGCSTTNGRSSTTTLLSLTQKYRSQTAALVAKQESLLAEHKAVFELERQLWVTEREMWEEERKVLMEQVEQSKGHARELSVASPKTRHFSISSKTGSEKYTHSRNRESSGGGSGIGWFLKQGSKDQESIPEVSPRNTFATPTQPMAFSPRAGSSMAFSPRVGSRAGHRHPQGLDQNAEEVPLDDDDLSSLPPSLLAEASRLIYGDRERKASNGTRQQKPSFLKSFSDTVLSGSNRTFSPSNGDSASVRTNSKSESKSARVQRGSHYLASFSEDSSDAEHDDDESMVERRTDRAESQPHQGDLTPRNPHHSQIPAHDPRAHHDEEDDEDVDDESVILKLRTSTNFGSSLGSLRKNSPSIRGRSNRSARNQVLSSSTFYDPETPVESIASFSDKGWTGIRPSALAPLSHSSIDAISSLAGTDSERVTSEASSEIVEGHPWVPPQSWMQPSTPDGIFALVDPTTAAPPLPLAPQFYNHPYAGDSFTLPDHLPEPNSSRRKPFPVSLGSTDSLPLESPAEIISPVRELDINSPTYTWSSPPPVKRPPPLSSIGMPDASQMMSPPLSAVPAPMPMMRAASASDYGDDSASVEQAENVQLSKVGTGSMDGLVIAPVESTKWTGEVVGGMI